MINLAVYTTYSSTTWDDVSPGVLLGFGAIALAIAIVMLVGMIKTFIKAGKPGWAAIVPIYNSWTLAEIAGKPGWWGLYVLIAAIPFFGQVVGLIVGVIIALGVARNFGKSDTFGVAGLFLVPVVGYAMLGFGDARYQGGEAAAKPQTYGAPQDGTSQDSSHGSSESTPPPANPMS